MNKMKLTALAVAALVAASAPAAEPDGYYDAARGKSKGALLAALESCISDHTTIGYSAGLEDLYKTSDTRADGSLWDMYSTSSYSIGNACGNYKNVGDCWNREHSMPKSWFNKATPMYSDAFHVYPTDGKVNGQRGNLPYGECANGTTCPPTATCVRSAAKAPAPTPATPAMCLSPTMSTKATWPAPTSIWPPATIAR